MYQALVRLPSHPDSGNQNAPARTGFDWRAFARSLLRLFRARR